MTDKIKIGVIQLRQTSNKLENFKACENFISNAANNGAKVTDFFISRQLWCPPQMAFLPENFDFISENKTQLWELSESIDGDLIKKYRNIAKKNNIFLSLGGFHRKVYLFHDQFWIPQRYPQTDIDAATGKVFNTHLIIDNSGDIRGIYDKLHLFDLSLPTGEKLKESDSVERGGLVVPPVDTPLGLVGMSIVSCSPR